MADRQKFRTHEALNGTAGGEWSVNSAGTAGSSADVTNTTHLSLSASTATLAIYSAVAIYFNFATSATDVNASNDLILPKETQTFLTVPRGLGATVYFNYNSTTTTTGAVRTVEI
jgi:hypothetical protein